uniref:peptidylprolyl isomerase n=1 Tax=Entomoneis paludosa TaxID=265537 RepID=A0A7S2V9E0_9STRA|mmetsp:Transcript_13101/g.27169  ORF Transcript_13101/g.27169 Transcript_13101/m.27169 type:complete len:359 (+) Transcript_13101:80-1156(+)
MTRFQRKKTSFPHSAPMRLLQISLGACLLIWFLVWWTPSWSDDGEAPTKSASLLEANSLLRPGQGQAPLKSMGENESGDGEDTDDNAEEDDDQEGADSDAMLKAAEEEDEDDEEDESETDDSEPMYEAEAGDGGEENDDEENEEGEEAEEQRRLQANENNGEDQLDSKTFVMELKGLTGDEETIHEVVLETRPAWAPIGAAHFHELVENGFYDQCRFFRVVPNFIVQFGINGDPKVQKKWRKDVLKDDPVIQTNSRGTITYATAGANTRTVQLFVNINENGNAFLDKQGFAPFAEITKGLEYIDMIDAEYGEQPDQGQIQSRGNEYLNKKFPKLSYIMTIREKDDDTPDGEGTEGGGR